MPAGGATFCGGGGGGGGGNHAFDTGFYECDAIARTVALGEYDGDGENVEDDAASIFTIILCLTTLHRCCSNSGYVCINIYIMLIFL